MVHKLSSTLNLEQAECIAAGALGHGRENGFLPLTIVVLDAGGQIVIAKREDGCGLMRFDVAFGKAWGALGMGMSGRTINERLGGNLPFMIGLVAVSDGRMAANAGGVLILGEDGLVVGAVGISGDTGDNDELCAVAGIRGAGLGIGE